MRVLSRSCLNQQLFQKLLWLFLDEEYFAQCRLHDNKSLLSYYIGHSTTKARANESNEFISHSLKAIILNLNASSLIRLFSVLIEMLL
jgi:hypothetical protein